MWVQAAMYAFVAFAGIVFAVILVRERRHDRITQRLLVWSLIGIVAFIACGDGAIWLAWRAAGRALDHLEMFPPSMNLMPKM